MFFAAIADDKWQWMLEAAYVLFTIGACLWLRCAPPPRVVGSVAWPSTSIINRATVNSLRASFILCFLLFGLWSWCPLTNGYRDERWTWMALLLGVTTPNRSNASSSDMVMGLSIKARCHDFYKETKEVILSHIIAFFFIYLHISSVRLYFGGTDKTI